MNRKAKAEALRAGDIIDALTRVTKEKSVSPELVIDALKDALATGARRLIDGPAHVEVEVDRGQGNIEVYTRQTVVEEVTDPEAEISLDDAKKVDEQLEVGDELIQDLDISQFGRTAIQTAKQVIIQRVREAERAKVFDEFSERIGELVTGTVQQIDRGNVLMNLGQTEALMPWREQIRKEHYRQGDTVRACIVEVKNNPKGPQVIVSRASPEFLKRLFELEVPEIFDHTIKIVKAVRDPGHRSKIAVTTNDSRVDPVGACVGMRGNRVQAIVRELSNERIDIINWTDEESLLIRRVFAPAEVKRIIPVTETKLVVVVAEEDLAQAIGREGQNIRLASRMVEKEIDIYGDEEFASFSDEERDQILHDEQVEEEPEAAVAAEGAADDATESADGEEDSGAVPESQDDAGIVDEQENHDEEPVAVTDEQEAMSADETASETVEEPNETSEQQAANDGTTPPAEPAVESDEPMPEPAQATDSDQPEAEEAPKD